MAGKAWWLEQEATGHTETTARDQRAVTMGAHPAFSSLCSWGPQSKEGCCPHFEWVCSPHLTRWSRSSLTYIPRDLLILLTINTNHCTGPLVSGSSGQWIILAGDDREGRHGDGKLTFFPLKRVYFVFLHKSGFLWGDHLYSYRLSYLFKTLLCLVFELTMNPPALASPKCWRHELLFLATQVPAGHMFLYPLSTLIPLDICMKADM